jgi:rubrerythrin
MVPKTSLNSEKIKKKDFDQMLRLGIIAEMDAINLYEQMAALAENTDLKNIFLDIAKEEKAHMGKLHALLLRKDYEQEKASEEGKRKVDEISFASKTTVKPVEEQKVIKPTHPVAETEKPRPIPPIWKTAIKSPEEPKPIRQIDSTQKTEKPHTASSSDTQDAVKPKSTAAAGEIKICSNCGYKANGPAPNRCPSCGAQAERFKSS